MIAHLEFLEASAPRARRWLIAAVLMLSAHAVAGTLAIMTWPEDSVTEEEAGTFLVELSPVVAAPQTEKLNLAIGQRSEEAAPAVAPTEEVKEKSEVETPKVEEAPLAPTPEVVVEKQKPVEEVDEKEEKEDPRPEQKATPQASVAAQETAAPPPVDAPVSEKPTAPKQGVSSRPSQAVLTWHRSVTHHLNKHKKYPGDARRDGHEGIATVMFALDRSGKVISTRLQGTSGSTPLDQEALEVLERASPFPPPPLDEAGATFNFTLPIEFKIKR